MDKYPDMNWPGGYPYDVLSSAGINPNSSVKEIRGCRAYYMKRGQMDQVRSAYVALEGVDNRLFIDFFLYRTASPDHPEGEHHG